MDWDTADLDLTTFWGGELSHDDFIDWSATLLRGGFHVRQVPDGPSQDGAWKLDPEDPYRPPTVVVCEGFSINKRTTEQAPDDTKMWSVKQIGHLETLCRWYGLPFVRQMPSDKSFDDKGHKLRKLGWWDPAPGVTGEVGHRRDAGRHAVKYAVDHHLINLRRLIT